MFVAVVTLILIAMARRSRPDEIVVARFNEDISWLKKWTKNRWVTVYNKGPNEVKGFEDVTVTLPNVGNEGHTYLWHIVNRYDTLAPRTVFIMGSAVSRPDRRPVLDALFTKLDAHTHSEFDVSCHDTRDLKSDAYDFQLDENEKTTQENTQIVNEKKLAPSPERPFGKWYETNFGDYQSKKICFVPNFAVTREDIRRKPKSYYENLLKKYLSDAIHPEAGHYFERAWYAIFYC